MVYVEIQLEDIDIHQISRIRYNRRRHIDVNNIKICRSLKENRFAVKMIETFFLPDNDKYILLINVFENQIYKSRYSK